MLQNEYEYHLGFQSCYVSKVANDIIYVTGEFDLSWLIRLGLLTNDLFNIYNMYYFFFFFFFFKKI